MKYLAANLPDVNPTENIWDFLTGGIHHSINPSQSFTRGTEHKSRANCQSSCYFNEKGCEWFYRR